MKWFLTRLFLMHFCFFSFLGVAYATETYQLDPGHSYVLWHISHFGFSNPSGKWMAGGTLILDEAKPENSKVKATIQVANPITGIPKLDEHLKGKDFFDVAKFPTATFESNKIEVTGENTGKVYGILTVHGVSKPVVLDVIFNKLGMSPLNQKKTVGFTANTQIKRSDFGINQYLPGLGDDVKLDIEVEGVKKS